ncbi:glycosyltransferase family 61 protein [Caldimonas caldifontis]|uniref:Glycosyltransferase 61 catalytic domain-containing protein n=1 Tax=Caldimonas caldifontis TaxID=1452508 RepID=A0A2S5SS48_9BURK|nr:glycosyltransferase family 61 protein [Caldimonas caldifontis]PPE65562.1 hypothetical protein C1704_14145 [Caldimonas caldifontis]
MPLLYPAYPAIARLRRKLGFDKSLEHAATRTWVLQPAETRVERPALYDTRELDRVTACQDDTSMSAELERLRGGPRHHGATVAHLIPDVYLLEGHLFRRDALRELSRTPLPWISGPIREERGEASLAASRYGVRYFGHWMTDDLPTLKLATDHAPPISPRVALTRHQTEYLTLTGLEYEMLPNAYLKQLIVFDDIAQNRLKALRYAALRERFQAITSTLTEEPTPGVVLLRRNTGHQRVLTNEDQVAAALRARGFRSLCPEEHSVSEILAACRGARVAVGVEGSHLAHAIYTLAPGGSLVVLQPPQRFNNVFKDICDAAELSYAMTVGHPDGDGFRVNIDALLRLVDRMR